MWPDRVVVLSPAFDEHLRFLQRVEDFSAQKLVAELSVEGLVVSVLPGDSRFDEQGSAPILPSQALTALAVNSEPLSERI